MAKRKGKSGSGEAQYTVTQHNLDKKGKKLLPIYFFYVNFIPRLKNV